MLPSSLPRVLQTAFVSRLSYQQFAAHEVHGEELSMVETELTVSLVVNGARHELLLEPRVSLLDVVRERLDVTGPKKGCNQGACGACTVWFDGECVTACLTLAVQVHGRAVMAVGGWAKRGFLWPMLATCTERDG